MRRTRPLRSTEELEPCLVELAAVYGWLDELVPLLPRYDVLRSLAHAGWRRGDLVDALERLAADDSIPVGDVAALFEPGLVTRSLLLLVRTQLGVGATSVDRVALLAHTLIDEVVRDAILVRLEGHRDAAVARLAARAGRAATQADDGRADVVIFEALWWSWDRVDDREVCRARREALDRRLPRLSRLSALSWELAWRPNAVVAHTLLSRTAWPRASLTNVAPRVEWAAPRWAPAQPPSPLDALDEIQQLHRAIVGDSLGAAPLWRRPAAGVQHASIYRAFRTASARLERPTVVPALDWPFEAQLAALDGMADAEELAPAALDTLEDLARARAIPVAPSGSPEQIGTELRMRAEATRTAAFVATVVALCAHAPGRWLDFVGGLASSLDVFRRERAAQLLELVPLGVGGIALLADLDGDPSMEVRRAAWSARSALAELGLARRWLRTVAWCALRDDPAAELVWQSLPKEADRPRVPAHETRRMRRLLGARTLSVRAGRWVAVALDGGPSARVQNVSIAPTATLTATDGRSIDVSIEWERSLAGSEMASATIAEGVGPRTESLAAALAFVRASPSSFMRLVIEGQPDRAVVARAGLSGVTLEVAEADLLRALPSI